MRKGGMSMTEYLKKMKELFDKLATAGGRIPVKDQISCSLAGHDGEYLPMTAVFQELKDLTWPELHASLLSFEAKLIQLQNLAGINSMSLQGNTHSVHAAEVKNGNGGQFKTNRKTMLIKVEVIEDMEMEIEEYELEDSEVEVTLSITIQVVQHVKSVETLDIQR
ncbi:hypothetical protein Syun_023217 [Stephania yunnanensis]|uniref:Uncharacterized protein n=1 Tax=Stephania yunnanensis TaxID=152371 RepID=A0AAP0I385_9MAGN